MSAEIRFANVIIVPENQGNCQSETRSGRLWYAGGRVFSCVWGDG